MKKLLGFMARVLVSALICSSWNANASEMVLPKEVPMPTKEQLLRLQKDDQYIGDKNASVTIIEYSSLSCPHCAEFHESIFPKIKSDYVDKNKVLYIHRSFPTNKPSLIAAALTLCSGKYFNFLKALFKSQSSWAFHKNFESSLLNIAKLSGMDNDEFKRCTADKELLDKIYHSTFLATRVLDVKITPTVLINGQESRSLISYKSIAEEIEQELLKSTKVKEGVKIQ